MLIFVRSSFLIHIHLLQCCFNSCLSGGAILELEEEILDHQIPLASPLQCHVPWDSAKQVPQQAKACSLKSCSLPSSVLSEPQLYFLTPECYIPDQLFLVSKYDFLQDTSPHWLLSHPCQDDVVN